MFARELKSCFKENANWYADFLCLSRPPVDNCEKTARKLHMWRCTAYPDVIKHALEMQAVGIVRRNVPHWVQKGPDATSWDGWVWSNADGWFWTQEGGWVELIPGFGSPNALD